MYLLLLGPEYGYTFPETGQSATHDEWQAAKRAGMPIHVFRNTGSEFEAAQEAFAQEAGRYGSGRFWRWRSSSRWTCSR